MSLNSEGSKPPAREHISFNTQPPHLPAIPGRTYSFNLTSRLFNGQELRGVQPFQMRGVSTMRFPQIDRGYNGVQRGNNVPTWLNLDGATPPPGNHQSDRSGREHRDRRRRKAEGPGTQPGTPESYIPVAESNPERNILDAKQGLTILIRSLRTSQSSAITAIRDWAVLEEVSARVKVLQNEAVIPGNLDARENLSLALTQQEAVRQAMQRRQHGTDRDIYASGLSPSLFGVYESYSQAVRLSTINRGEPVDPVNIRADASGAFLHDVHNIISEIDGPDPTPRRTRASRRPQSDLRELYTAVVNKMETDYPQHTRRRDQNLYWADYMSPDGVNVHLSTTDASSVLEFPDQPASISIGGNMTPTFGQAFLIIRNRQGRFDLELYDHLMQRVSDTLVQASLIRNLRDRVLSQLPHAQRVYLSDPPFNPRFNS